MTPTDVRHVVAWHAPAQWAACVALWAVFVAAVALPEIDLPLRAIAPAGFVAALLRTMVLLREGAAPAWLRGMALSADAVLLTGLLDITGGPFNPFVVIYVVNVWLAAVSIGRGWGVIVAGVALSAFGWLVVDHLQVGFAEHHRLTDFPTHLFTMLFTGSTVVDLVAHYVGRARNALAERQRELEQARERAIRSERLASLTTLAAGAAHELSTPLSTIAVVATELERTARSAGTAIAGDLHGDVT
jgi:two-component system sensor histidine kinase RegB